MKLRLFFSPFLIFMVIILPAFSQTKILKQDYIDAIRVAEHEHWQKYQTQIATGQRSEARIQRPRAGRNSIRMPALLYSVTGERTFAEHTREYLLNLSGGDAWYIVLAVEQIRDSNILSPTDMSIIEEKIIKSADRALNYWVEWGAMNHATNHIVNNLVAALRTFPDHPRASQWRQKLQINLDASWGRWSIEDAQIYIPVWLKPLMQYAEITGREEEFYALPTTKYYFDYLVQLMTPGGQIAEFGDGRYGRGYTWTWMISVLEKGASVYNDGEMKWAAHRLFEAHVNELGHQPRADLCEAVLWADDSIAERIPTDKSRLVLEDYVGKKVVFRDGWDRNATFLFLNYLDDPGFGVAGKEYLVNTINVEAEKNHHGHADENAICLLMKNGSILLYDSAYRETSSTGPDGQFRADHFHNKLVVRDGLADPDFRLLPTLLDGGRYKPVETRLMHFHRFRDVDISRTRLLSRESGYQWDRLISYVKELDGFVVLDFVKINQKGPRTLATLYHTQNISAHDVDNPIWFDTYYHTIAAMPNLSPHYAGDKNDTDMRLLVYFPDGDQFRIGAEQMRNNVQTQWAIYAALSDSFDQGDMLVFPSLLIPHHKETDPQTLVDRLDNLEIFSNGNGYGLKLPMQEGFLQINAMKDLEAEYLEQNIRPRYTFESGRAVYGKLVTDARYCCLRRTDQDLYYSFVNASRLLYNENSIFQAEGMEFGQDSGVYRRYGVPKWSVWEGHVHLSE